jgi:hypothetical protein
MMAKEASVRSFSAGDRVSQRTYGDGTVTAVNEYHTVIDFDEHGVRTFSSSMVQLERSNTTAPVRAKGKRKTAVKTAAKAAAKTAKA